MTVELLKKFEFFEAIVTKKCGEPIIKLRTDSGDGYVSKDFQMYLSLQKELNTNLLYHSLHNRMV